MKSFQYLSTRQEYIDRIERIKANAKPSWGKMSADQMVKHLSELIELAEGKKVLKSNKFLNLLLSKILKKRILNNQKPLPKGLGSEKLPANKGFIVEKKALISLITHFELNDLSQVPLPLFGKMNAKEWDSFLVKQFEHHLSQFGV